MNNPDVIFFCKKCEHQLYVGPDTIVDFMSAPFDCPNCGEEGEENWIMRGRGNFDHEHFTMEPIEND